MTDKSDFSKQVEFELHTRRAISQRTCQAWKNLPYEARTAFARAMLFLGCLPGEPAETLSPATPEADRVAATRLMLLKLGVDSDDPRWSSDVLERLLKAVMEAPGGSVGDLFCALFGVLGDYTPELSKPLAYFIKDLVVKCFACHQHSYESVNWRRLADSMGGKATRAQLYLALHAIPPPFVPPELACAIAKGLESTAFHEEGASALAV